jgi:hypothetical protein
MQTAGKPMEEAVRRVLNMPSPKDGIESLASKVNQLHIYVAKKLLSASSSSTSVEMLPPAHLPSPVPLLGLLCSIMLYIGGTVLAPKWSVHADAFLNYERMDLDKETTKETSFVLWNWFEEQKDEGVDPYYQSALKKPTSPAVLIHEVLVNSQKAPMKGTICPLFLSPENTNNSHGDADSLEHFLDHPRRYFFEYSGRRYYYDPFNEAAIVSGGPNLNELSIHTLLSDEIIKGLGTESKLSKARERYGSYSHISIPVPTLTAAFTSRITSPLVALQLVGRLLSVLEDETIGKSLANLGRLAIQHFSDAKRSIEAASILAKEVKDNEDLCDKDSDVSIWAVRPTADNEKGGSEWIQVSPSDLLPGDVFIISSTTGNSYFSPAMTIPVDGLLLEGVGVTEEAALTGESVPQASSRVHTSLVAALTKQN